MMNKIIKKKLNKKNIIKINIMMNKIIIQQ